MTFEESRRRWAIKVGRLSYTESYFGEFDCSIYSRALCHPLTNELVAYVDRDGIFKNAAGNPFGAIGNITLAQVLTGGADAGGAVITGLGTPSAASDAATKGYTDAALLSLRNRTRVRLATTDNVTLSTVIAGSALDGVTLSDGDVVLIKNQSTPAENGIYVAAVSGTPARSSEFDTFNEFAGLLCAVEEGTNNGDSIWLCTSNETGTIGVTALNFSKVSVFAGARFTDSAARAATTPDFVGQEGYQIDTGEYYFADGTTAGDWGKGMRFAVSPVIASSDGLYLLANGPVRFVDANTINAWTLNASGAMSGSSTLPSSSGVLALQSATPISAREYGALGDGATDDTAALQAAIAAADTQKRPLYIPPGTYQLTDALNVPSNGSFIFGSGGDRTVLRQTVNGKSVFTFTANINLVNLERLRLQGNGAGTHTVPGIITPASGNNIDDLIFRDVEVRGFSMGIELRDVANAILERVGCFENGNGMRVYGNANGILYDCCAWIQNSGYGLRLESGRGHVINSGEFGGPLQTSGQLIVAGAVNTVVNGMNMEVYGSGGSTSDAIQHTGTGTYLVLNGVGVADFSASGLYALSIGVNTTTVNNCVFTVAGSGSGSGHIRQTSTISSTLDVLGVQYTVDVFNSGSYFGTYRTNPLINLTELQPSGAAAAASTAGRIQRRMETGTLETWIGTLRKADGSYEYVSLTPLRTANTWALAQTFSNAITVTSGGMNITGNVLGSGDYRAGASSFFYWTGRSSIKSPSDGSISFRNQTDTADSNISAASATLSGSLALTGGINLAARGTIASATTTSIGALNELYLNVTGTTTITGLGSNGGGGPRLKILRFDASLTLTHGSTLILPGGANIVTQAGDIAEFIGETTGWTCVSYTSASGVHVGKTIIPPGTTTNPAAVNTQAGVVNLAAGIDNFTVTGSFITANSIVIATVQNDDTTAVLKCVVPYGGGFTIKMAVAGTGETKIGFFVVL